MASLTLCDVCNGAVKDKPINLEFTSNSKLFKKTEKTEENMYLLRPFGSTDWNFEKDFELCESCGIALLNLIERAQKKADLEVKELKKSF